MPGGEEYMKFRKMFDALPRAGLLTEDEEFCLNKYIEEQKCTSHS